MARHPRQSTSRVPTVVPPQPQTLTTARELPRRRTEFPPRYTFELGASIGGDLTVIGHLSAGRLAELYQVWSAAYLCALTCKIILPQLWAHLESRPGPETRSHAASTSRPSAHRPCLWAEYP